MRKLVLGLDRASTLIVGGQHRCTRRRELSSERARSSCRLAHGLDDFAGRAAARSIARLLASRTLATIRDVRRETASAIRRARAGALSIDSAATRRMLRAYFLANCRRSGRPRGALRGRIRDDQQLRRSRAYARHERRRDDQLIELLVGRIWPCEKLASNASSRPDAATRHASKTSATRRSAKSPRCSDADPAGLKFYRRQLPSVRRSPSCAAGCRTMRTCRRSGEGADARTGR